MPCDLTIRGARRCQDYTSEYDRFDFSSPISERVCRGVALGCEWTPSPDDSCDYARDGTCNEEYSSFYYSHTYCRGNDSTDCGRKLAPGVCSRTLNETVLSSSRDEVKGTASASSLFRSGSGVIGCHVADGCTGLKVSDLKLHCRSDFESPAGPFQVSGNVEMTIVNVNFSDCRALQDGGVMRIYNGAKVTMEDSIIQRSSSRGSGGGVALVGAQATFTRSSFLECTAAQAGGAVWGSDAPRLYSLGEKSIPSFTVYSLKSTV